MIEWDERRLEELVRKMGLEREPGQEKPPIHMSLYNSPYSNTYPLLMQIMWLDAASWSALGCDETDRISVTRYLGSLKCRTDDALSVAARHQQPLTLELAKALIDAEACDKGALSIAAIYQQPLPLELAKLLINAGAFDKDVLSAIAWGQRPLTPELAKFLINAGCDPTVQNSNGWDALVFLAYSGHPVAPQVTDLFLSAGCRADLDRCGGISDKNRLRFDQILKEHAQWQEYRKRSVAEGEPATTLCDLDWGA